MKKFYRAHFLGCELFISIFLIGMILIITNSFIDIIIIKDALYGVRDALYGTLATLSGALLGFVITGISVLLTTSVNKQMEPLKRSDHYKMIFEIFFSTSKYLGILLVLSLIGLVIDKDDNPYIILTIVTLWSLIIVIFRLLRCLWVLENIVKLHVINR